MRSAELKALHPVATDILDCLSLFLCRMLNSLVYKSFASQSPSSIGAIHYCATPGLALDVGRLASASPLNSLREPHTVLFRSCRLLLGAKGECRREGVRATSYLLPELYDFI